MHSTGSDTVLVEAKREYTQKLEDAIGPFLYQGIYSLWKTTRSTSKENLLSNFQERLKLVPLWNQGIIDVEYNRITKEIDKDYLDKLIQAVFISNIKILATIRRNNKKIIQVDVPDPKRFIHECYIQCARDFFCDPYLIDDREDRHKHEEMQRNVKRSNKLISEAIAQTIRSLIPIQKILEKYLIEEDSDDESTMPAPKDYVEDENENEDESVEEEIEVAPVMIRDSEANISEANDNINENEKVDVDIDTVSDDEDKFMSEPKSLPNLDVTNMDGESMAAPIKHISLTKKLNDIEEEQPFFSDDDED